MASQRTAEPWPSWNCGVKAGSPPGPGDGHWASEPLSPSSSQLPSGFFLWHQVGEMRSREKTGLAPHRISLCSGRNQEGSVLLASGQEFLGWFCLPIRKYEHQRAGEGIFWSQQQNGENNSLEPPLLQPSTCSTSKRKKKFYVHRGKGGKFTFTIKKSQQDVLQSYKYTFSNSKYLY